MFRLLLVLTLQWFALSACAKSAHQTGQAILDRALPAEIRQQIDPSITFPLLQAAPSNFVGRTVLFSGVVLHTKRAKEHTEIEVLQLATGSRVVPSTDRTQSEGRFLALDKTMIDPATLEAGHAVTVVGTVQGAETRALDQTEYTYPVIEISRLLTWANPMDPDGLGYDPYAYYGGYYQPYPYSYPYWDGGAYGYGWGAYYPFFLGPPSVAPPTPPPQSIPPQFRKRD